MLCEKCHEREAQVRITKVINGVSETHNLCQECAQLMNPTEDSLLAEWSKSIFRLLSSSAEASENRNTNTDSSDLGSVSCPGCGKTYQDFRDNGTLGCPSCYEAFGPSVQQAILRVQGAENHIGKKPTKYRKKTAVQVNPAEAELTKEEEIALLEEQLKQAVSIEDYEAAASYRDQIRALKEKQHG